MKVAIVQDWLVVYGGAERVLEQLLDLYPQADLYALIDFVPPAQRHFLRGRTPHTSFLQNIPGAAKHYRKMLPLMPLAIEQFDLGAYDLVISSSYCVAKGVLTGPNQVHVCYCHSPMRYAWDHYHEYLREMHLTKGLKSWFARWQLHKIRNWDVRSNNSVDFFIANSRFVAKRIAKYYGRSSVVVHPPVDTDLFQLEHNKKDYYVAAGRFVPAKRLDLVAEAFAQMPDKKLVLVGDGPEMQKIRQKAGPNTIFTGFVSSEQVRDYLAHARAFIFPSEEDFGIVPVEAQACGTPVIAYGRGGALETVVPADALPPRIGASTDPSAAHAPATPAVPGGQARPATGVFFHSKTAQSIQEAVQRFEAHSQQGRFDAQAIAAHAQQFSTAAFRAQLQRALDQFIDPGQVER
jgi:glycosyltransferase involved in cell wall biosynthesis